MKPEIITTADGVRQLAAALERCDEFAVDLEADSMHCYREKVCLLQFTYAAPGAAATTVLLDPLAVTDLAALRPLFADASIRKIFHAADYDIRCLRRDFDLQVHGLFDTMICCQFLGEEQVGLAAVLGKYFDVTLDKQYQRADWSKRPLSAPMCAYAAADTQYLHPLAALLEERLREKDRLWWVQEEFELLEQAGFHPHTGPLYLRFKGAGRLPPRQLAGLENLLQWREKEACRRDCPPYKVLGNKTLLALAQQMPTKFDGDKRIEGLPPRLQQRYGAALLRQIAAARQLPESDLPHYPRQPRRERDAAADKRFTALKQWRSEKAEQLQLDGGVLINNATLERLAYLNPASLEQLRSEGSLKNWQLKVLGEELLARLHNAGETGG